MIYEYSFDRKSLWALFGGLTVLCLLLFFAGVLLGANWGSHDAAASPAPAASRPAPGAPDADAQPAPVTARAYATRPPQEPVLYDLPTPREYAAQGYGTQGEGAAGYAAQGYAAPSYAARAAEPSVYGAQQPYPSTHAAAPAPAGREADAAPPPVNLRREAARLSATGVDADPHLVSEADDATAEAAPPSAASYSVQVGTYVEEGEARRLLGELENKGYTPIIFSGRDAEGRTWHAVRIGAYANQREAAQAALNFTRQERLKAAVRPFGSL